MPAEIDMDALKVFTKSRTNETEYWQKIKNSQSKLKFTGSKKQVYFDLLTFENF